MCMTLSRKCRVGCVETVVVSLTTHRLYVGHTLLKSSSLWEPAHLENDPQHRRRKDMTTQQGIDHAKVQAFMDKVMGDNASAVATVMVSIGDRLGLFKALAQGPATSTELAER